MQAADADMGLSRDCISGREASAAHQPEPMWSPRAWTRHAPAGHRLPLEVFAGEAAVREGHAEQHVPPELPRLPRLQQARADVDDDVVLADLRARAPHCAYFSRDVDNDDGAIAMVSTAVQRAAGLQIIRDAVSHRVDRLTTSSASRERLVTRSEAVLAIGHPGYDAQWHD